MSRLPEWLSITSDLRVVYWDGYAKGKGSRKYSKRMTSSEQAERFASELVIEAQRAAGLEVRSGMTWKDLCQLWVDAHEATTPEGTMRRRTSCLDAWIIPTFGNVRVTDTDLSTLLAVAGKLVKARTGRSNYDGSASTPASVCSPTAHPRSRRPLCHGTPTRIRLRPRTGSSAAPAVP